MNTEGSTKESTTNESKGQEPKAEPSAAASASTPGVGAEELQNKLAEAEKKYLYLYSEFENFRRRNERDRIDFIKFGHEGFLKDLLQVVDNFERALSHARNQNAEKGSPLAQVIQGIEMIHYQLVEALKSQGVNAVASVGQKFDPNLHEAVGEEESKGEAGSVTKEMQKGYQLHGRLLRPARVLLVKKS